MEISDKDLMRFMSKIKFFEKDGCKNGRKFRYCNECKRKKALDRYYKNKNANRSTI